MTNVPPRIKTAVVSETSTKSLVPTPLPVAVIGCGRMGRLHAKVYSQMPEVKLVGVYDASAETAAAVAGEYHCLPFAHLEEVMPHVSAVTIATPTQFHAAVAEPLLARGIACLIEKPLARNADECRSIVEWSKRYKVPVQVGHIERFNPAVRALERLRIQPRFIEAIRISPLTFRSHDVGVVLDMMIHDLDVVLKIAGSPLKHVEAVGVSVTGGAEDVCNARLTFDNGCVANVTASRLALKTERRLRAFSPEAYVSLDYGKRTGVVVHKGENLAAIQDAVARIRSGEIKDVSTLNYAELVQVEQLPIETLDPLRTQLEAFVAAVQGKSEPVVTAEDGMAAVEAAERIVAAIQPQAIS
jgi:predicted dehydrogenase